MILVGYDSTSSNYRLFDPISKKVKVSRDVVFHEVVEKTRLPTNENPSESLILLKKEREVAPVREEDDLENEDDDDVFLPAEEEDVIQQ
jgi:hypothetical protein